MIGLSFDIEERFHSHLTDGTARREWKAGDRIAQIVDLLIERERAATFFIVGELAEHYPALIRRIADSGFEIGSHTHTHIRLDAGERSACVEDITRSKRVLEDITGTKVVGFRAPTWKAAIGDDWLWDLLISLGFRYDSSLFPFRTHMYGSHHNPVRPFRLRPELLEIPPSVWKRGALRFPYGGGFYFRLYPGWLTSGMMASDLRAGKAPLLYFHPWEFDAEEQPVETGLVNRFIGNVNVGASWDKLRRLLARYPTCTLLSLYQSLSAPDAPRSPAGRAIA